MPEHLRRTRTSDRGPPRGDGPPLGGATTEPLTVGEIGPNRSLLPDGSLLCRNVPIARTGWMQYLPGETPIKASKMPGAAPICYVHRGAEELFSESTMRSFIGCAITHEHPPVNVTPENFAHLGKGFVLRVERGTGADSDCLMADLIIKDKWLIQQVDAGKREVSCGYDADYIQTGEGEGAQANIIGNHLALVERGRCGPRCAIGDEDTLSSTVIHEETDMTTQATQGTRARVPLSEARARVADAEADLRAAEAAEKEQGVHVHVHMGGAAPKTEGTPPADDDGKPGAKATTLDAATEQRLSVLEQGQAEINASVKEILAAVKAGTPLPKTEVKEGEDLEEKTEATATMDSAALANGYSQFLAQAEILVPGFKLPTFDAAATRHSTVDRMCSGRRTVLGVLAANDAGRALLGSVNGGKEFDVVGASCADVAVAFKAAAAAKGAMNNRNATGDSGTLPNQAAQPSTQRLKSWAEINEENKKFWSGQGPRA